MPTPRCGGAAGHFSCWKHETKSDEPATALSNTKTSSIYSLLKDASRPCCQPPGASRYPPHDPLSLSAACRFSATLQQQLLLQRSALGHSSWGCVRLSFSCHTHESRAALTHSAPDGAQASLHRRLAPRKADGSVFSLAAPPNRAASDETRSETNELGAGWP